MSLIVKRAAPPVGGRGINYRHPRSAGLVFAVSMRPADGWRELVTGTALVPTGMGGQVVAGGVPTRLFGASNYVDFTPPPEIGANTPFTLAWTQQYTSASSYNALFSAQFGAAGTDKAFVVYQSSDTQYNFVAGPRRGGGVPRWSVIGAPVNNQVDRYVLQCIGGSQAFGLSDYVLWRNGERLIPAVSATLVNYTSALNRIGARETGTDPFEGAILDLRMWNRIISDAEAFEESQLARAGDLYEPLRIWVPVSAGGGGTEYTQTVVGSLSSGGYLIRQTGKKTVGIVDSFGVPIKHTAKSSGGSITNSGIATPSVGAEQSVVGTLTLSGVLSDAVNYVRSYTSQIISSGSLNAAFSGLYLQALSGIIAASGTVKRHTTRLVQGTLTLSNTLLRRITRSLVSTLTGIGSVSAFKFVPTVGGLVNRGMRFMRRFIGRR